MDDLEKGFNPYRECKFNRKEESYDNYKGSIYGYADYYNSGDDLTQKACKVAEESNYQAKEKVQSD